MIARRLRTRGSLIFGALFLTLAVLLAFIGEVRASVAFRNASWLSQIPAPPHVLAPATGGSAFPYCLMAISWVFADKATDTATQVRVPATL